MGRNGTQTKIKIKVKTILQRTNLHTGIFRLMLKAFPCTLVTATAHDTRKQRIRSLALFLNCKKQLKQFTLRPNNEDLRSSCNFLVCGCDHSNDGTNHSNETPSAVLSHFTYL